MLREFKENTKWTQLAEIVPNKSFIEKVYLKQNISHTAVHFNNSLCASLTVTRQKKNLLDMKISPLLPASLKYN